MDLLHPARFLEGSACSSVGLWPTARKCVGPNGVVPISKYDMGGVGLGGGGYVTPKGWVEINNPGSTTEISVFGVGGGVGELHI